MYHSGAQSARGSAEQTAYRARHGEGIFARDSNYTGNVGGYDERFDNPGWLHFKLSPGPKSSRRKYDQSYSNANPITGMNMTDEKYSKQPSIAINPRKNIESASIFNTKSPEKVSRGGIKTNAAKNAENSTLLNGYHTEYAPQRPGLRNMYSQGIKTEGIKNVESASIFNQRPSAPERRLGPSSKNVVSRESPFTQAGRNMQEYVSPNRGRKYSSRVNATSDSMFSPKGPAIVSPRKKSSKNRESASILNSKPFDNREQRAHTGGRFKQSRRNEETAHMFNNIAEPLVPHSIRNGNRNASNIFGDALDVETARQQRPRATGAISARDPYQDEARYTGRKNAESGSIFNEYWQAPEYDPRGRTNKRNIESKDKFWGNNNETSQGPYRDPTRSGGRRHLDQRNRDSNVILAPGEGQISAQNDPFAAEFVRRGARNQLKNNSHFGMFDDGRTHLSRY